MSYVKVKSFIFHCTCEAEKNGVVCGFQWESYTLPRKCKRCSSHRWNGIDKRYNGEVIQFGGKALTVKQWSKELGLKEQTIRQRIHRGWAIEDCLDPSKFVPGRKPKDAAA